MSGVGSPRQRGGACLCTLAWAACVPMFVGVRLSRSAWVALCGEASAGRCASACLSVRVCVGGRLRQGAPGIRGGGRAPRRGWVTLPASRAGAAPRAEPRTRRSGAEPARGPGAPGRAQAGPAPDPAPSPSPRRPQSPGARSERPEPRRRQRPWDAGIAPPGPLSLRPLPRALRRAESASRCSRPPRGAGRGPAGERAPPVSRSPPLLCVRRRPTFLPDGPEAPGRVPSTRQPLSQRGEGRERRRWPGPGVPWGVPVRHGSPPVPSPSGFPVRCRGPGDGELRPRLPGHRWRRLAEGQGLGPGFPRPETPRSEQPQGAQRMCLSRAGGERAERTLARTREQAKRSFSLGPGAWGDPAPGLCPGLDEISVPREGICARYRGSDL